MKIFVVKTKYTDSWKDEYCELLQAFYNQEDAEKFRDEKVKELPDSFLATQKDGTWGRSYSIDKVELN